MKITNDRKTWRAWWEILRSLAGDSIFNESDGQKKKDTTERESDWIHSRDYTIPRSHGGLTKAREKSSSPRHRDEVIFMNMQNSQASPLFLLYFDVLAEPLGQCMSV